MMKFWLLWMMVGCAGVVGTAHAQERTAGSTVATQMSWSALSTQINAVSTKTDAVNTRVDQAVVCGRKNMIYAPGAAGADADGCVIARPDPGLVNTVNTMNTNLTNLTNNVNSINACAANGGVYNKATNTCASSGTRWFMAGTGGTCGNCENGPPARWAESLGYGSSCGGARGTVGRLCTNSSDRCHRIEGSQSCSSRGGDSSDHCTSSRWAVLYACE